MITKEEIYKQYIIRFKRHPIKSFEKYYGIKLYWYQKIYLWWSWLISHKKLNNTKLQQEYIDAVLAGQNMTVEEAEKIINRLVEKS